LQRRRWSFWPRFCHYKCVLRSVGRASRGSEACRFVLAAALGAGSVACGVKPVAVAEISLDAGGDGGILDGSFGGVFGGAFDDACAMFGPLCDTAGVFYANACVAPAGVKLQPCVSLPPSCEARSDCPESDAGSGVTCFKSLTTCDDSGTVQGWCVVLPDPCEGQELPIFLPRFRSCDDNPPHCTYDFCSATRMHELLAGCI
jgi:hypothetical protein